MHNYYITPEEYEIAKKNGINEKAVYERFYKLNWNKEKTLNTPIRKTDHSKYVKAAEQNGIQYGTFVQRVNNLGWSRERAATTPILTTEERRIKKLGKNGKELLDRAEANGINYNRLIRRLQDGWDELEATTLKPLTKAESGRIGALKRLDNLRKRGIKG